MTDTGSPYGFDPIRVIASRCLTTADGVGVTVRLCAPQRMPDAPGDWYCAFRIEGPGAEESDGYALGIDAVQALLLATATIGNRLAVTAQPLTFLGGSNLGFPQTTAHGIELLL
ncbi:hypothetical protein I6N91_16435 [Arthrobacter sp. MSA 4-2]|uniref:DUF6968 family protein n=1 Tax=Arthrobacter sp. MSA 4-2 TaxID=2794349 RepID=UPI0018E8B0B1|nr:hypothetical protein [Arthrobacter sp. MSA 4-2]MBJ2122568.1 hypothetical protein [Arthrobacter sp. MSA 4-2]